jgi:tetratricopeptide (TPR) repeat protein
MAGEASRRLLLRILGGALLCAAWPLCGAAFANVEVGQRIEAEVLATLDGGREPLFSPEALANVFVFFRPGHDRSLATLKAMAACEKEFADRPVHWVAVVSAGQPREAVRAAVTESGIRMPVLLDEGDRLYGKLGVRLHPVVGVADDQGTLLAYVPFHQVNYCDMIRVRIRFALREADQAAVDRVDHPPKAVFPNEVPGAVARRHVNLGERFVATSQWAKAADQARIALELEPGMAAAQALLGRALAGQGKCGEARRALDQALAKDPANAAAAEARRRCEGRK